MDTTVWDRATARSADVDRRESRIVLQAAIVVGVLLILIVGANQLGLARPAVAFTGTTVTAVDAEPGEASVYLDVRNRGVFAERVDGIEIDYPGLTVRSARFVPETLGAFEGGQLAIDVRIDCDAPLAGGAPAWDEGAALSEQPPVQITTERRWGTVSAPWGTVSDTLPGWDVGWSLLSGASGVCTGS